MKWKAWGSGDAAEITADAAYSIHHGPRGWQAWQRLPHLKRIGTLYELASDARAACENHEREKANVATG